MEANNQFLQRHHTDHDYNTIYNHDNYDDEKINNNNQDGEMREEGSGVGGSRWNPTKEQIEMLEVMYNDERIRTPSAEQIQQITTRLKVYGHIEAKNVFYWFQNHKARQRQKLKQQRLAALNNHPANHNFNHINRFLGRPSPQSQSYQHHYHPPNCNPGVNGVSNLHPKPIFPAPPMMINNNGYPHHHYLPNPNVICSPYYKLPQPITTNMNNNMGFYPQHSPQYNYSSAPAAVKRSTPSTKAGYNTNPMMELPRGGSTLNGYCAPMMNGGDDMVVMNCMGTRTLDLFPVHPTGILEHKFGENNSAANSSGGSSSSDTYTNGDDHKHQGLLDFFFSGHASSESD